jgi:anhydro-N-acetylmuramic acid kinase
MEQYMNVLARLQATNDKLVIGLMSGTSVDGIDAILLHLRGSGVRTKFEELAFLRYPYGNNVRHLILKNSVAETSSVEQITRLNFLVGELFAKAAARVVKKAGYRLSDVELIGSHGQTIHHLPRMRKFGGRTVRATLQIGDPSVIAKRTGVPTVGDFRVADVALGGQGAPLVPYVDYLLFRSRTVSRGLLNIGGIANLTVLPKNCAPQDVRAFDTGPGNMIVDALMKKLYHKAYDEGGRLALQGKPSRALLRVLALHPFIKKRPPKSTGREEFGANLLKRMLAHASSLRREDVLATGASFTAYCAYQNYKTYLEKTTKLDELIVSGGGVHNEAIMKALRDYFKPIPVRKVDEYGISADAKEALCFAILANETIAGNPANLPSVTGAARPTVLGKICL